MITVFVSPSLSFLLIPLKTSMSPCATMVRSGPGETYAEAEKWCHSESLIAAKTGNGTQIWATVCIHEELPLKEWRLIGNGESWSQPGFPCVLADGYILLAVLDIPCSLTPSVFFPIFNSWSRTLSGWRKESFGEHKRKDKWLHFTRYLI